ncbi:MAG: hypothetical protein JO043_05135, partial [Candidatus Eremiobacteraeota bacterium]|nr:hypothetical protein [Candidatus Eremiobacteraeota bacterium]
MRASVHRLQLILFVLLAGCSATAIMRSPVPRDGIGTTGRSQNMRHVGVGPNFSYTCSLNTPNPPITSPLPTKTVVEYQNIITPGSPQPNMVFSPNMWVYYPNTSSPQVPTIFFIAGGGLHQDAFQDGLTKAAANTLASDLHAIVVFPSYTFEKLPAPTPSPGSPSEVERASADLGCELHWFQQNFKNRIPTAAQKVLIAGYSAGGQLAGMLGTQPTTYIQNYGGGDPSWVAGVAAMSGRYDWTVVPCCDLVTESDWLNMHHGTSPLGAAANTSYKWFITYEQCDADTQLGDSMRLARALNSSGNDVTFFEGTPKPGEFSIHGDGDQALGGRTPTPPSSGAPGPDYPSFKNEFYSFYYYVAKNTNPSPSPNPLEKLPNVGPVAAGVRDVAVGGDGSIWGVGQGSGDQPVVKYAAGGCVATAPTPRPSRTDNFV